MRAYAKLSAMRKRTRAVVLKPAPAPAPQQGGGEEERPDDRPKCPKGHVLEEDQVTGSEGYCDVCDGIFSRFACLMSCFECQHSVCELCYVKRRRQIREELKSDFRYTESGRGPGASTGRGVDRSFNTRGSSGTRSCGDACGSSGTRRRSEESC